jgi:hypothetical protein
MSQSGKPSWQSTTMTVVADDEQMARDQLVANYTDDEKGHTLEDMTLLDVFPVVR